MFATGYRDDIQIDTAHLTMVTDMKQIAYLKKFAAFHCDTSGSRSFAERMAAIIHDAYNGFYNVSPEEQFVPFMGLLKESVQIAQNQSPDYRIDKSPTSTMDQNNMAEWYRMDIQEHVMYTTIKEQPRYSYNQVYELATRIGFPTEYAL